MLSFPNVPDSVAEAELIDFLKTHGEPFVALSQSSDPIDVTFAALVRLLWLYVKMWDSDPCAGAAQFVLDADIMENPSLLSDPTNKQLTLLELTGGSLYENVEALITGTFGKGTPSGDHD